MNRILLPLILAFGLLTGCASPKVIYKTERVEVPVPVMPVAPPELAACGSEAPGFKFYKDAQGNLIVIPQDQEAYRRWTEARTRCIRAWRAWAGVK